MEFEQTIDEMSGKVRDLADTLDTEEATKNALIMPFIRSVLGYDVFNPQEVVPEFTADVGLKRGEKVDYALVLDGKVQILVECKKVGTELTLENASQLYRYFACTEARIGVLTNGRVWNFYMDIDAPNRMDSKPFLVLDLLDVDKSVLPELKKLTKPSFDIDSIASSAEELKYTSALKRVIADEFREPDDDMVRMLGKKVYDGMFTQQVVARFHDLVDKAMKLYMADQVNDRLTSALNAGGERTQEEPAEEPAPEPEDEEPQRDDGIVTTDDEVAAYLVVKAIACSEVAPERVTLRDAKSYCAVFLDDNNRRPIAHLYFNSAQYRVSVYVDGVEGEKAPIYALDDIYGMADAIRAEVRFLADKTA